jgi:hypothetical protein
MKTDEEIAEEVRKKFSYMKDKRVIESMAQQSVKHHHEHIARQAKLKELAKLPTWEDDSVSHDPWAPRCMNCGRWTVGEDFSGQYGPTWYCPKCNKR